MRLFELALLHLFLTLDAVAGPGNSFETFGVDFVAAIDAFPKAALADAGQSHFDHTKKLPVIVALGEKEFLSVGIGGTVSDVLGSLRIGYTAVFLRARHHAAQLLLPLLELLPKLFQPLFFHNCLHSLAHLAKSRKYIDAAAAFGETKIIFRRRIPRQTAQEVLPTGS